MDQLRFRVNEDMITLNENKNGQDTELIIRAKTGEALTRLHQLRDFFENDKIYTDILFYSRKNRVYQVIVRRDAYTPFVVHLFQLQLLLSVEWVIQ